MFDQTGNAFCAADTARSTSARSPSATFARRLSSCGFRTSNVLPDAAGTNLLSMNRLVLTWMFGSVSGMKPLPKGMVCPTIASRLRSTQRARHQISGYATVLSFRGPTAINYIARLYVDASFSIGYHVRYIDSGSRSSADALGTWL